MHPFAVYFKRFDIRKVIFVTLLMTTMFIIGSPLKSYASQSGISFYSPNSPPAGVTSLEPLIGGWWNFWANHPASYHTNWPQCVRGQTIVGHNQSVVFLADPASAVQSNVNATRQNCEISNGQLLYLTVYTGECSEGEYPDMIGKYPELLKCAQDSNKVIKLMQVNVDGMDVSSNIIRQTTSQPFVWTILSSDNPYQLKTPCCHKAMGESYYLLFKPLPVGDHTMTLHVIRVPLQANQPVENDVAKWAIKVVP